MRRTLIAGAAVAAVFLMTPTAALADELEPYAEPDEEWTVDGTELGDGGYVNEYDNATYGPEYLRVMGVVEGDDGRIYTWYSEKVLPGEGLYELNSNGRHVDENGYVVDGDGYIAIASPWGDPPIGTVIDTPFGAGMVYDVCEGDTFDVYTSW